MILIFGAGLLGTHINRCYPKDTILYGSGDIDITDLPAVRAVIKNNQPDVIINAAGVVPSSSRQAIYPTNAAAPYFMQRVCDDFGVKLIQVSTDCVFSGKRGKYTEEDKPDPVSNYGESKLWGEVYDSPHLTVRTSFIGFPDAGGRGLLAWLSRQQGKVPGYHNAKWNGLTTIKLAKVLVERLAYSYVTGLVHIHALDTTKYEMISYAGKLYGWPIEVYPVDEPVIDRRLRSVRWEPVDMTIQVMLEEMFAWNQSL